MKQFKVVTLFPEFFDSPLQCGLFGKAVEKGIIKKDIVDLRNYSDDKFRRCDDYPYGGGSGMVLEPEPLFKCLEEVKNEKTFVIYTTPSGYPLTQQLVKELSQKEEICIICGHYEGIDQRVIDRFVDIELSIGDYVVSGGEYAALVIMDAVARYEDGFMSNSASLEEESFENGLLEYPHYTRPAEFKGMQVPEVLTSGNHALIKKWRYEESLKKTEKFRPDLYKKYNS